MEKNIEIEFKALLTKEQYKEFLVMFENVTPYVQINYYFDTKKGDLMNKRIMLRVRFKNNTYELTLKRFGKVGLDEFNEPINEETFERLKNGLPIQSEVLNFLAEAEGHKQEDLIPSYSLTTTRYDLPYKNGLLSLDYSEYLDTCDYELEYEAQSYDEGLKIYKELTEKHGIHYKSNCFGKRHRCINRVKELQNKH